MSLVIYEATQSSQCDRSIGEEATQILWQRPPELGDQVFMGGNRRWKVVHVEKFSLGSASAYFVIVNRLDIAIPPVEDWLASIRKRNQGDPILYADVAPNKEIVSHGSAYPEFSREVGERLVTPLVTEQGVRGVPSPWVVERIETLDSDLQNGFISAIRFGWCKEVEAVAS
jgi:hypothetical protein